MGEAVVVERVYQCDRDYVVSQATNADRILWVPPIFSTRTSLESSSTPAKDQPLTQFFNERPCNHSMMSILAQLNDYLTRGLMVSSGKSKPIAYRQWPITGADDINDRRTT